jgi:hypothetical protein
MDHNLTDSKEEKEKGGEKDRPRRAIWLNRIRCNYGQMGK